MRHKRQSQAMYQALLKGITDFSCPHHLLPYQYFLKDQLACQQCPTICSLPPKARPPFSLSNIFDNPVSLMVCSQLSPNHSSLIFDKLQTLTHCSYKKSQYLLTETLDHIREEVNRYCQKVLREFEAVQDGYRKVREVKEEIEGIMDLYRGEFYRKFSQQSIGSKEEFVGLLKEYQSESENPLDKLKAEIVALTEALPPRKVIDWEQIETISKTVLDPFLWKKPNIISQLPRQKQEQEQADSLIPHLNIDLSDQKHKIRYGEGAITISSHEQALSQLQVDLDCLYEISKFRLAGFNYDEVKIFQYFGGDLRLLSETKVPNCREILALGDTLVMLAGEKVIKFDICTGATKAVANKCQAIEHCYFKDGKINPQGFRCQIEAQWQTRSIFTTSEI